MSPQEPHWFSFYYEHYVNAPREQPKDDDLKGWSEVGRRLLLEFKQLRGILLRNRMFPLKRHARQLAKDYAQGLLKACSAVADKLRNIVMSNCSGCSEKDLEGPKRVLKSLDEAKEKYDRIIEALQKLEDSDNALTDETPEATRKRLRFTKPEERDRHKTIRLWSHENLSGLDQTTDEDEKLEDLWNRWSSTSASWEGRAGGLVDSFSGEYQNLGHSQASSVFCHTVIQTCKAILSEGKRLKGDIQRLPQDSAARILLWRAEYCCDEAEKRFSTLTKGLSRHYDKDIANCNPLKYPDGGSGIETFSAEARRSIIDDYFTPAIYIRTPEAGDMGWDKQSVESLVETNGGTCTIL